MGAMSPSNPRPEPDAIPSRFTPPPSSSSSGPPSSRRCPPDPATREKKPPIQWASSFSSPTSAALSPSRLPSRARR
ncbi:unnamed protein product [Urochloa humidicola]